MSRNIYLLSLTAAASALTLATGAPASAEEISRTNWIPNVGQFSEDAPLLLGDLWTFECPNGGYVNILVDTTDDRDTGESDIDPVLLVFDGRGNLLALADDEVECTFPPVCGFSCPQLTELSCGAGTTHSIAVQDFGPAIADEQDDAFCQEGGGYELHVEAFNRHGNSLSQREVQLGGGQPSLVPEWALELGAAPTPPALDDEGTPSGVEDAGATEALGAYRPSEK